MKSVSASQLKKDKTEFRIDVLDENYLQPYNYQRMLKGDPKFLYGLITHVQVQGWMKYLHLLYRNQSTLALSCYRHQNLVKLR